MKRLNLMIILMLLALLAGIFSCTLFGDDDDDDDSGDDDDDTDEEPCMTQAKQTAQAYCESLGLEADFGSIGLGTSVAECDAYCGGQEFTLDYDCLDGVCICCM